MSLDFKSTILDFRFSNGCHSEERGIYPAHSHSWLNKESYPDYFSKDCHSDEGGISSNYRFFVPLRSTQNDKNTINYTENITFNSPYNQGAIGLMSCVSHLTSHVSSLTSKVSFL